RVSDTWFEWNSDIPLHRATSHRQRLASDPGSVRREDAPGPFRVLPAAVRVPAKVATRAPPGKKRHVLPGNRKHEARAEWGKPRWCPHPPPVRSRQPLGFLLWVLIRNRIPQQRSHFFLDVDDDVRLTQIFGQAGVLTAQFLDFFFHRVALGLRPAFLWGQRLADSMSPLSPPVG